MGDLVFSDKAGWWIASYIDSGGRRRRHRVSRIEREAKKILSALEGQAVIDRRLGIRPLKRIRFGEFAEKFVAHAKKNVPRSWERYEDSAANLLAFFGNEVELTAIEPEGIERFKARRVEKVKPPTVNRDLQALKRMFNLAVAWGYARENPVKLVKFFREPQGRVRYLTVEQYEKVVEACRPHLRPLVVMAVHTGLRQGDLLRLRWTDIDLDNGYASVERPKNDTPRHVALNDHALKALLPIKFKNPTWVFTNEKGEKLSPRTAQWQFDQALEAAGIREFRFHDLRHTCATWLAMAGENQELIKEVLGHKDIRMTDRYTHFMPGRTKVAVKKLDRFLRAPRKFIGNEGVAAPASGVSALAP